MRLATGLMPGDGKNVTSAVSLATQFLAAEPVAGTILVVADDLDEAAIRQAAGRNGVAMLRMAPAQPGDGIGLGSDIVRVSVDGTDIQAIEAESSRFQAAQGDAFGKQWRDEGYWLLLPLALLCLLWFRVERRVPGCDVVRGQGCREGTGTAVPLCRYVVDVDQQGRIAFDRGDYPTAAQRFADPMWRGIAAIAAPHFRTAAQEFRKVETVEGRFALGNAEAQNHAWEKSTTHARGGEDELLAIARQDRSTTVVDLHFERRRKNAGSRSTTTARRRTRRRTRCASIPSRRAASASR